MTQKSAIFMTLLASLTTTKCAPAEPASYKVSGIVSDSRTGAPVPFCRLRLFEETAQTEARRTRDASPQDGFRREGQPPPRLGASDTLLLADAHGRFSLTVAHAGRWRLAGVARGYRTQFLNQHGAFSETIVLSEGQPVAQVALRLDADAEVSGVVLDEAGEPVRQAQVIAEDAAPAQTAFATRRPVGISQTDDLGHYELAGLAPGAYRLHVQASPWYTSGNAAVTVNRGVSPAPAQPSLDPSLDVVYPPTYYPGKDEERLAEILTLAGGEQRRADFHLQPIAATHLVLPRSPAGADGERGGRSFPTVTRVSEDGRASLFGQVQGAVSQTDTEWNIGGLSPGRYEVHMVAGDGRPGEVQQIDVQPGGGGTLALPAAGLTVPVTLKVIGADLNDLGMVTLTETATGRIISDTGRGGARGRRGGSDEEPPARVLHLAPGRYTVTAPGTSEAYVTGLKVEGEGAQVNGMTLEVKDESPSLLFEMATGRATLTGTAARNGAPVPAAMVLLVPISGAGQVQRAETASDGSFALSGLVPGSYIALALDAGWSVNWQDTATLTRYLPQGVALELKQGARATTALPAILP